jgi:hypothetical protein
VKKGSAVYKRQVRRRTERYPVGMPRASAKDRREAASILRRILSAIPFADQVAAYLRGHADALDEGAGRKPPA